MTRWLVFDRATAAATHAAGGQTDLQPESNVSSAIADAVDQQRTVVLVVPAGPESATVARITPPVRNPRV